MSVSILAREDRVSLGNGMVLRLLSAGELLQARRKAHELAQSPLEQPLCSNAPVRFDFNGKSHWVGVENGKVAFNPLVTSVCVNKGSPATCRIIKLDISE